MIRTVKRAGWVVFAAVLIASCAATKSQNRQQQAASVIEFLYPGSDAATPVALASVAELRIPLRIGLAFVPDRADLQFRITEAERVDLLSRVRQAFERYPFVAAIEVLPSSYLQPGGGFDNLERVARLLSLDCVALLSYDQMQFADATNWTLLYWTGIGAYVVPADRYDIMTSVEAAVFDIPSRKLLMRAGGTSKIAGHATMIAFAKQTRAARAEGFSAALGKLIPNLHAELKGLRERAPSDATIRLDLPPGYDPAAMRPAAVSE